MNALAAFASAPHPYILSVIRPPQACGCSGRSVGQTPLRHHPRDAPGRPADVDKQRAILAGLLAARLDRNLSDGAIVVVGMGRNVGAVSEHPTCIASPT